MNVLVVDDSVVFRSQIKAALESAAIFSEIDTANNGKIALQKLKQKKYDIMTLDLEMPELDGIETLKALKAIQHNTRIIVFSAHSYAGGVKTLESLALGADDFVAKPSGEGINISNASKFIAEALLPKVKQFLSPEVVKATQNINAYTPSDFVKKELSVFRPHAIVIASSTGGPVALEKLFNNFKTPQCPIFIAQHMPPVFTKSLAARLQQITGVPFKEGEEGEIVENGCVYIAPGDYHMTVKKFGDVVKIHLDQRPERNHVRPAADFLFETVAEVYKEKTMGFILTGMGEDGKEGAIRVKANKGGVCIQNKESCVVFGMPGAVYQVGAFDEIKDINDINLLLRRMVA